MGSDMPTSGYHPLSAFRWGGQPGLVSKGAAKHEETVDKHNLLSDCSIDGHKRKFDKLMLNDVPASELPLGQGTAMLSPPLHRPLRRRTDCRLGRTCHRVLP